MQYWQSGLNLQKTHYSLSLINHVYYYHPLFSMDVLTNTWTGNLVKVVIPRPDPSGAPVAGVGKVSSCQLLNLLIAFGLLSQLTSILIHELALRCRCFWNMQMWRVRPKRRWACTGGSLAGTRWWLCSTLRTSSPQSSTMDEVRNQCQSWRHGNTMYCFFFHLSFEDQNH